MNSCVSCCVMF